MQKFKLINNKTKKTIYNLVTINEFDYYIKNKKPTTSHALLDNCYYIFDNKLYKRKYSHHVDCKLILCTNNSNIDIPKVIDELDSLVEKDMENNYPSYPAVFRRGYSKAKETYKYTEEDLISFAYFYFIEEFNSTMQSSKSTEKLLSMWKEQQITTIFYE